MNIYGVPSALEWETLYNCMRLVSEGPSGDARNNQDEGFGLMVELGTFLGGFAGPFISRSQWVPHFHYLGFEFIQDAKAPIPDVLRASPRAWIRKENFLEPPAIAFVRQLLEQIAPRKALFVVDGFKKGDELAAYYGVARTGDHFFIHDFDETDKLGGGDFLRKSDLAAYVDSGRLALFYPQWWIHLVGTASAVKTGA